MADFNFRPAELTVPRNSEVRVVRGAGVRTAELRPGQSIIVDLEGVKPGTYTVCDQPGHVEAGQVGTLTIT